MRPSRDIFKGFRECYSSVLKAIVANVAVSGIMMGIPSYFLLFAYLFQNYSLPYTKETIVFQATTSGYFYTMLAFTIFAWILALLAIKFHSPTILNMCSFGHSAVGSWWLVNFVILFFAGWSYIPAHYMFAILLGCITPAIIWHINADVIRAYKRKLVEIIETEHKALAQMDQAFVTGAEKV
jgi:hypothetical protein